MPGLLVKMHIPTEQSLWNEKSVGSLHWPVNTHWRTNLHRRNYIISKVFTWNNITLIFKIPSNALSSLISQITYGQKSILVIASNRQENECPVWLGSPSLSTNKRPKNVFWNLVNTMTSYFSPSCKEKLFNSPWSQWFQHHRCILFCCLLKTKDNQSSECAVT